MVALHLLGWIAEGSLQLVTSQESPGWRKSTILLGKQHCKQDGKIYQNYLY